MLREARENIAVADGEKLLQIADFLCHQTPVVRPIFECVKVFVRLHESGQFTYARHPSDLGTTVVAATDISSRMKSIERRLAIREALEEVEFRCQESWPFSPGSSSWILVEVLHPEFKIAAAENKPTIIFRKAVRLNSKGKQTSTPLLERMFNSFKPTCLEENDNGAFQFIADPAIQLSNISGTGLFSDFREQVEGMLHLTEGADFLTAKGLKTLSSDVVNGFIDGLLESNFEMPLHANPGFYFHFEDSIYQIRSREFSSSKEEKKTLPAPLPVFGIVR
jgi:hypothetical protein